MPASSCASGFDRQASSRGRDAAALIQIDAVRPGTARLTEINNSGQSARTPAGFLRNRSLSMGPIHHK